jgi:hypothetical protein
MQSQPPPANNLYRAQTATTVGPQEGVMAEGGDLDPGLLGNLQDGLSRLSLYLLSINRYFDHPNLLITVRDQN